MNDFLPTFVTSIAIGLLMFIEAAVTVSPISFFMGFLVSGWIVVEPFIIMPSAGIVSPFFTNMRSPGFMVSVGIFLIFPFFMRFASDGMDFMSFLMGSVIFFVKLFSSQRPKSIILMIMASSMGIIVISPSMRVITL